MRCSLPVVRCALIGGRPNETRHHRPQPPFASVTGRNLARRQCCGKCLQLLDQSKIAAKIVASDGGPRDRILLNLVLAAAIECALFGRSELMIYNSRSPESEVAL